MPDASLPDVLSGLRRSYRRLRAQAAGTVLAGLVLPALVFIVPLSATATGLCLAAVLSYVAYKSYRLVQVQRAIDQLRLETRFTTHTFNTEQFGQCLARTDHLWQRSCTLHGLRQILEGASPEHLRDTVNLRRMPRQYRKAFRTLWPPRLGIGVPLALLATGPAAWAAGQLSTGAPLFWVALFVLPGLPLAEGLALVDHDELRERLRRLERTLTAWTLKGPLRHALRRHRRKPYRHTPLYHAPTWLDTETSFPV